MGKFLVTTMKPESWLVVLHCNTEGHERFVTITQVVLTLRWNHKYASLILQQSWAEIERQTWIRGYRTALNLNQIRVMGKFSISNEKHNIRNIIWNAQGFKTGMLIVIREADYQGCNWTVATWVTRISCMLDFLVN